MQRKRTALPTDKLQTYSVKIGETEYNYEIKEPAFNELSLALSSMIKPSGAIDLAGGGKAIWDTCCTQADVEIEKNPRQFVGVCLHLAKEYLEGLEVQIKKK